MTTDLAPDRSATGYGAYKYQWARYIAKQSLDAEIQQVKREILNTDYDKIKDVASDVLAGIPENPETLKLRDIARNANKITFGERPVTDGKFKMGIVGSGIAGLFTAALIDELNKRVPSLDIDYDVLEAGGKKRLGGRLYTYRFEPSPEGHQYYDVGAMRFPKNAVMHRTFQLFDLLGIKEGGAECPRLVKYFFSDESKPGVCPKYYNDIRYFGNVDFKATPDPYSVNKWLPKGDPDSIDPKILAQDPNEVVDLAIEPLVKKLQSDLDSLAIKNNPLVSGKPDPGWKALMDADFLSTREFFRRTGKIDDSGLEGCGYNFNTIEWIETYAFATGWYNQSLSETVLEAMDFMPPKGQPSSNDYWYCIEGGTQMLPEKLAKTLKKQPQFNRQVTAINTNLNTGEITLSTRTTKPDDWDESKNFESSTQDEKYFTVFNSTTLGALQKMDLSKANLLYGTKQAIRSLNYGASCKVAIQFSDMWWLGEPWNINKGGLGKTDLPLRVCVYPSYNIHDKGKGVLLCSYSWAQDAQRMGTLIDPKSPQNEAELKELMLSNLALLHAKPEADWPYEKLLDHLRKLYITHHAYDWYHDPNMSGAFGYFGPGQFSKMWPQIIKPNGWLFLIGEAASAHHGWIVGALESSVRAVFQLMTMLNEQVLKEGGKFTGYADAMKFLVGPADPKDPDWSSPFVGLPRELPYRQLGTAQNDEVQDSPEKKDVDLSFVAAQVITSFYQMVLEIAREEEAKATK